MSKLEFVNNHLKNAKINNKQMEKICYYFAQDFTASKTAQSLKLSRQTINSYYKLIRKTLIDEERKIDKSILNNDLKKNGFVLKYLTIHSQIIYYIVFNSKIYILNLDDEKSDLNNLTNFIKYSIKNSLVNHKKANSVKVFFNTHQNEYFVSNFLKSTNNLEIFVNQRLRKFRGITKHNIITHIEESIIRFETNEITLYSRLSNLFRY